MDYNNNPYYGGAKTAFQQYGPAVPYSAPMYQTPSYQAQPSASTVSVIWVQGIEGAKAYPVLPGQEVMLMDSENPVLYTKKADAQGRVSEFETYDLVKRESVNEQNAAPDLSQYVKISDMEKMVNDLIDSRFDAFTSSGKK